MYGGGVIKLCKNGSDTVKIEYENTTVVVNGKALHEEKGEPYQFPEAGRTVDGNIYVTCTGEGHKDTNQGYEIERICFVSKDKGENWSQIAISELAKGDYKLDNGCYFQGAVPRNSYSAEWIANYTAAYSDGNLSYYYAKDIKEFNKSIVFREYDPLLNEFHEFEGKVNWEYMPVVLENGLITPLNVLAYLANFYLYNNILYMTVYSRGFDSELGNVTNDQYNIYLFESIDNARTWTYVSQILSIDNDSLCDTAGFNEPHLIYDGYQFYMVLRTGTGLPCYITNTDNVQKWTKPCIFQNVGVKPQLALLDNGILVTSYGRPGIFVKASKDRERKNWTEPYIIDDRTKSVNDIWEYSCCYTSMVSISKNELLIFYCDFQYPINGENVKAVICQRLKFK